MAVYKVKKTGRWAAQHTDTRTGHKRQVGTFATRREAVEALRAEEARSPSSTMTVAAWRERWLATPTWKESTRAHNAERTRAFAKEHGRLRLARVDRTVARAWIAEHPSTLPALSAMFGAAAYEDDEHGRPLLAVNPFSRLVRRRKPRRDLPSGWLTEADIEALEGAARRTHGEHFGTVMANMIRFAAETGVRPGELFVLRHEHLRVREGRLIVAAAAESKTRTIGPPKNGRPREVALSRRAAQAALTTPRMDGQTLLFATPHGRQFWLPALTYHWKPVRAAIGRPDLHFYTLRHYCATRLLEAGQSPEDVAIQLGHTDMGELVREVYGRPAARFSLDRVREALDGEAA